MLLVVALGLLFFMGIRTVRRTGNTRLKNWARIVFILILSVPVYGLLTQLDNSFVLRWLTRISGDGLTARRLIFSVPLAVSLFLTVIAFFKAKAATRLAISVLLIVAPLIIITFSQAIVLAVKYRSSDKTAPTIASRNGPKRPRILWMVFDELDFRVAFAERPKGLKLPELDRLASESLFADNAYPPAGETLLSLPALITGKLISEAHREGPDKLIIKYGDDQPAVSWGTQPNIFSRVRAEGFNTALFGWYHPYCRIIGQDLTKCAWDGLMPVAQPVRFLYGENAMPSTWHSFVHSLFEHVRTAALTVPFVSVILKPGVDVADVSEKDYVLFFNDTLQRTTEAANDPELELILTHWAIPHPPNIYDRQTHQISTSPNHSYLDNLELVDETLGKVRKAMESKGSWEDMVVLVSSDHWWRPSWKKHVWWTSEDESTMKNDLDRRVPFILKMPGRGDQGIVYEAAFNTVLSQDLMLAILKGEVSDTKAAARWLDQHRSIARSPYDTRSYN